MTMTNPTLVQRLRAIDRAIPWCATDEMKDLRDCLLLASDILEKAEATQRRVFEDTTDG